ncbi:MAG TPA: histidine kinase [Solirubrobacteraceae bacterium]|nr:histidine kinase [Solirubrobacteraceae bacterium]
MATTGPALDSARAAAVRERALARNAGGGVALRPVTLTVGTIIVLSVATTDPAPALHGLGLGVVAALVVWAAGVARVSIPGRPARADVVVVAIAAAAVALAALQPHGVGGVASSVPVFVAFLWLGRDTARAIGIATAAGLVLVDVLGSSGRLADVLGTLVLLALMAATATLMRQARDGQEETELLYARLQDARDAQAQSAALAERTRIAGELHDVLAHSLSGAAIQLQGARRILAGAGADAAAAQALDRAAELVRDGLGDARRAVGALRGDTLQTIAELPALVAQLALDLRVDVTFESAPDGAAPRAVGPQAGVVLYRATQEAITNAARHAPGSRVVVRLQQDGVSTTLTVDDDGAAPGASSHQITGGGHGLESMRERTASAGGRCEAGPRDGGGWRVRLELPA